MTNVVFLNTFFPVSKTQNADYETKIFIEVAREAIAFGEMEFGFGKETEKAINKNKNLAPIALWHYEKGIERYRTAINHLEQAKSLAVSPNYKKYIDLKLKKCLEKLTVSLSQKESL